MNRRIGTIVVSLRNYARQEPGSQAESFPVAELVEHTLSLIQSRIRASSIEIRLDVPADLFVSGQRSGLMHILMNLLMNSIDAIEDSSSRWIAIASRPSGTGFEITVTDSGGGISPQNVAGLFVPFFTTKPVGKGMGLGLSLSRTIALSLSGDLSYDSSSPNTKFTYLQSTGLLKTPASNSERSSA